MSNEDFQLLAKESPLQAKLTGLEFSTFSHLEAHFSSTHFPIQQFECQLLMTVQCTEKTSDSRHDLLSVSRGSVDKQAAFKTVSPSGEKRETTTTTKFGRHSPEGSSAGNMNAAAAAAAAAALSHQRMLMSPLPFDRVSVLVQFLDPDGGSQKPTLVVLIWNHLSKGPKNA